MQIEQQQTWVRRNKTAKNDKYKRTKENEHQTDDENYKQHQQQEQKKRRHKKQLHTLRHNNSCRLLHLFGTRTCVLLPACVEEACRKIDAIYEAEYNLFYFMVHFICWQKGIAFSLWPPCARGSVLLFCCTAVVVVDCGFDNGFDSALLGRIVYRYAIGATNSAAAGNLFLPLAKATVKCDCVKACQISETNGLLIEC